MPGIEPSCIGVKTCVWQTKFLTILKKKNMKYIKAWKSVKYILFINAFYRMLKILHQFNNLWKQSGNPFGSKQVPHIKFLCFCKLEFIQNRMEHKARSGLLREPSKKGSLRTSSARSREG